MRFVFCDRVSKNICTSRCCFKSSCSPSTIKIQSLNLTLTDDGTCIRTNIYNSSPLTKHFHFSKDRIELNYCSDRVFNNIITTSLCIRIISVSSCTNNKFTFIRLTYLSVYSVRHNNCIDHRFNWFRH